MINNKLKFIFGAFIIVLSFDMGMTLYTLSKLGYGFEANPVINGPTMVFLIKGIAIIFSLWLLKGFDNKKLSLQYIVIGFFMVTIIMQTIGGISHTIFLNKYDFSTITMINPDTAVVISKDDGLFHEISPDKNSGLVYAGIVLLLGWLPLAFGYINLLITQWAGRKNEKTTR